MKPLVLQPNQLHRFYRGGDRIAALRGIPIDDDHTPEDWIGAVNASFGTEDEGLGRFADGSLVRERIAADPEAFLGAEHVARFGTDSALLVKLLDAGERLPVHYHPGRLFAEEHLGSRHGKSEAWLIIEAEPGATVNVGWRRPVEPDTLRRWIADQDAEAMLAALHEWPVRAGDTIFVPAGTAHAIGAGILMVEVQEPTDFSILLEHVPFGVEDEAGATLGLGWELALQSLSLRGYGGPPPGLVLPPGSAPYFRAERLAAPASLDPGYSVLVALDGDGRVNTRGGSLRLTRGMTALIPHAAGAGELEGDLTVMRCRPPDPKAGQGRW